MGNRSNLYLTNTAEQLDFQVLEANNQLPFFWVLLLDRSTITDNDDLFPIEPDENSPYRSLPLSRDTLLKTTDRSKQYVARFYPQLAAEFTRFSDYIIGLSERGTVEVDLLEITNFSSPREFRDDTLALLQRRDSLQPLSDQDRNEYISEDPDYLIGFDDYATISPRYSELSDSYRSTEHRSADQAVSRASGESIPTSAQASTQPRHTSSGRLLLATLPLGITGALIIIGSLWLLIYDDETPTRLSLIALALGFTMNISAVAQYRKLRGA